MLVLVFGATMASSTAPAAAPTAVVPTPIAPTSTTQATPAAATVAAAPTARPTPQQVSYGAFTGSPDITCHGQLVKFVVGGSFTTRYFVLRGTCLLYYETHRHRDPKGVVSSQCSSRRGG